MLMLTIALASALHGPVAGRHAAAPSNPFEAPASQWSGNTEDVPTDPVKEARMPRVSASRLHSLMQGTKGLIVVDARDSYSYATSHILGAINIPLFGFSKLYRELPKDRLIALYCT